MNVKKNKNEKSNGGSLPDLGNMISFAGNLGFPELRFNQGDKYFKYKEGNKKRKN